MEGFLSLITIIIVNVIILGKYKNIFLEEYEIRVTDKSCAFSYICIYYKIIIVVNNLANIFNILRENLNEPPQYLFNTYHSILE